MAVGQPETGGQDLKEQYGEEKKEELVVQRRSVVRLL